MKRKTFALQRKYKGFLRRVVLPAVFTKDASSQIKLSRAAAMPSSNAIFVLLPTLSGSPRVRILCTILKSPFAQTGDLCVTARFESLLHLASRFLLDLFRSAKFLASVRPCVLAA